MRKVSDHMRLVKREAGANPARTRHRDSQATAYYHWETGKVSWMRLNDQPGDLPFAVQERYVRATRNWQYKTGKRTFAPQRVRWFSL